MWSQTCVHVTTYVFPDTVYTLPFSPISLTEKIIFYILFEHYFISLLPHSREIRKNHNSHVSDVRGGRAMPIKARFCSSSFTSSTLPIRVPDPERKHLPSKTTALALMLVLIYMYVYISNRYIHVHTCTYMYFVLRSVYIHTACDQRSNIRRVYARYMYTYIQCQVHV